MRSGRVSATAKVIAASTILLASDRRTAGLVAPGAAVLCRHLLSSTLADRMLAGSAGNPLVRPVWRWMERWLLPGIMAHYWRRKRWIEKQVRVALARGFVRVIVLGAGFDTLSYRLARELPDVEFIEVDHPATQAAKREGLASAVPAAPANIKFVAADLERDPIPQSLANDAQPTIVIAEGLLMYLRAEDVDRLLASLWQLSAGPVRLVFSYIVRWPDGTSGFRPSSAWIDRWLAWRGEPFTWVLEPRAVRDYLAQHQFALVEMATPQEFGAANAVDDAGLRGENLVSCDAFRSR
jgi:methyltransferase (TIGR00027 family)